MPKISGLIFRDAQHQHLLPMVKRTVVSVPFEMNNDFEIKAFLTI